MRTFCNSLAASTLAGSPQSYYDKTFEFRDDSRHKQQHKQQRPNIATKAVVQRKDAITGSFDIVGSVHDSSNRTRAVNQPRHEKSELRTAGVIV